MPPSPTCAATAGERLPRFPTETRYGVEMFIAAHDGQTILEREGGDPRVVRRNGTPEFLQRCANAHYVSVVDSVTLRISKWDR